MRSKAAASSGMRRQTQFAGNLRRLSNDQVGTIVQECAKLNSDLLRIVQGAQFADCVQRLFDRICFRHSST